jgi:hypothetical protein
MRYQRSPPARNDRGMLALLFVTLFVQQSPASQPSTPSPCSSPEHRQFDFWIGEWDVALPDGQVAGRNRIESVEGGCGLQENWTAAGPQASTGRSINAYSSGDRKWHQIWLGSGGLLMHLSGTFTGDTLLLEGNTTGRTGQTIQHRLSFTRRGDGTIRQFWQTSSDGTSWQTAFEGIYTRRK